jgi:hypothetical protein
MQTMRQIKDNLKSLPKLEQKEILNKKRLEIRQNRSKKNKCDKLKFKIKTIENLIKNITDSSFFETISKDNFIIVEKKYWKEKSNIKMRISDYKYFFFEIYLPNFFNKTRFHEALRIVFEKNKQDFINQFLTRIEDYEQELLTLTNK